MPMRVLTHPFPQLCQENIIRSQNPFIYLFSLAPVSSSVLVSSSLCTFSSAQKGGHDIPRVAIPASVAVRSPPRAAWNSLLQDLRRIQLSNDISTPNCFSYHILTRRRCFNNLHFNGSFPSFTVF